jgi:hypothetical protein
MSRTLTYPHFFWQFREGVAQDVFLVRFRSKLYTLPIFSKKSSMITTKILGGLGNQFFQYALGRRMALAEGSELRLDLSDFKTYFRPYFLDRFAIQAKPLTDQEAAFYRRYQGRFSISRWLEACKSLRQRQYREEKPAHFFHYLPDVLKTQAKPVYLSGYWQHAAYFEPIRERLVQELSLLPEHQLPATHPLLQRLEEKEVIAVHFRRGDYQQTAHGILGNEYYIKAVDKLLQQRPNAELYLFSNEIDWVKQNISFDAPVTYIAQEFGLKDYQEFDLMRRCQHQIIANSTFSWWAAWLNPSPSKIVFTPKKWLATLDSEASGLILPSWNTIT